MFLFFVLFFLIGIQKHFWNFVFYIFFVIPFFFSLFFSSSFLMKNAYLSLDNYSFMFLILTMWVICLSIFCSFHEKESKFSVFFLFFMYMLMVFLYLFFSVSNFFFFFFFFESVLFPIIYIIFGWGNNFERFNSSLYLFLYTLFSSLPMLISLILLFYSNFSLEFSMMTLNNYMYMLIFFLIFSFLIKMPMFFVHSWLPKAHVEAPVSGSMILAGILLKMGGYGIYRFMVLFYNFYNNYFIYISVWGGLLMSLSCLRQTDLKCLVAFSSISHMSLVIICLLIFNSMSIKGSMMLMIAHGLCSSCMFFLVNVIYERSGSRSIFFNKGLLSFYPSLSLYMFIICSFNMSAPPSLNLISELYLFISSMCWLKNFLLFFIFSSFFTGVYNIFLFSIMYHGMNYSGYYFLNFCFFREYLISFLHIFPLSIFFLKIDIF